MSQPTLLVVKTGNEANQAQTDHQSDHDKDLLGNIMTTLVDAAIEVGALIDAVCCRYGDWIDWQSYRPLPGIRSDNCSATGSIIRLALAEDIFGLRAGGYIEMRVVREERAIEVCGGYYDAYDQPEPVIDGSLRWDEVNHQKVGQVLMMMHDRIIRAHLARDTSDDSPAYLPLSWSASAGLASPDSTGGMGVKAMGIA